MAQEPDDDVRSRASPCHREQLEAHHGEIMHVCLQGRLRTSSRWSRLSLLDEGPRFFRPRRLFRKILLTSGSSAFPLIELDRDVDEYSRPQNEQTSTPKTCGGRTRGDTDDHPGK